MGSLYDRHFNKVMAQVFPPRMVEIWTLGDNCLGSLKCSYIRTRYTRKQVNMATIMKKSKKFQGSYVALCIISLKASSKKFPFISLYLLDVFPWYSIRLLKDFSRS